MHLVFALTPQTGRRLAEIGFLCIVLAGVWIAASQIPQLKLPGPRMILAGVALAVGGILLIIAIHWGHLG